MLSLNKRVDIVCYFVYGALYGDIDENAYKTIENKHEFKIHCGTKHSVKNSVLEVSDDYRITDWCCDCDFALGRKDINAEEIKKLEALFNEIKEIGGAKHIYLCKTWTGKRNKGEIKLRLDDIDIKSVLANFKENCLYTFEV